MTRVYNAGINDCHSVIGKLSNNRRQRTQEKQKISIKFLIFLSKLFFFFLKFFFVTKKALKIFNYSFTGVK